MSGGIGAERREIVRTDQPKMTDINLDRNPEIVAIYHHVDMDNRHDIYIAIIQRYSWQKWKICIFELFTGIVHFSFG